MTDNKALSDLRVKSVKVLEFGPANLPGGSGYRPPAQPHFVPGTRYKLQVVFGNNFPPVRYPDEQFRKDLVEVRIVGKGFRAGSGQFVEQDALVFYTDAQYSTPVTDRFQYIYRPQSPIAGSTTQGVFPTDAPDVTFDVYFKMVSPRLSQTPITKWIWDAGIYGSVRNRVWRQIASSI